MWRGCGEQTGSGYIVGPRGVKDDRWRRWQRIRTDEKDVGKETEKNIIYGARGGARTMSRPRADAPVIGLGRESRRPAVRDALVDSHVSMTVRLCSAAPTVIPAAVETSSRRPAVR